MSSQPALANMEEWPPYEEAEGNTTAQRIIGRKSDTFLASNWTHFAAIRVMSELFEDDLLHATISDPLTEVRPTTVWLGHSTLVEGVSNTLVETVGQLATSFTAASLTSLVTNRPREYALLRAIAEAPDDQRLECMRVLGLMDAEDEEDYVERGPDPQAVDFELMALLEPGNSAS